MRKLAILLAVALPALAVIIFFLRGPRYFDSNMNGVFSRNVVENPEEPIPFMADLHCDMLLWNRNFFGLHNYGHMDLPRMQKANMAFQVFTIVSKVPKGINIEQNDDQSDQITLLSLVQLRPLATWFSLKKRALHQCSQLHGFAQKSNGDFRVVTSKSEMTRFIEDRKKNSLLTAGMLGLEGAHCLEADIDNLEEFFKAGVRYIGPVHFFDNEWGGSAHGMEKGGLTDKGRELIKRMEELNIIVDLAHSSSKTIEDILAITSKPLIVSHTGVKGTCDNQRNLSDDQIREIGNRNGLIGIGLWETAVCGTDAAATARSIKYVADMIGVDKVALGSDFDGAIKAHFDITGLPLIAEALQNEGFNKSDVDMIMGGNIRDFMLRNLPD